MSQELAFWTLGQAFYCFTVFIVFQCVQQHKTVQKYRHSFSSICQQIIFYLSQHITPNDKKLPMRRACPFRQPGLCPKGKYN